ncbi:MAG: AMP-binding protein [Anaerolineales bacterium]|jgi:acetyl-CoA synthetase
MNPHHIESVVLDGQYNIGHICTRQQCVQGRDLKIAFRYISPTLEREDFTFAQLDAESNRYANLLQRIGIKPGQIVATFLPKLPDQFFAFLGILKIQAVVCTLFYIFGEDALLDRLSDSQAVCLITKTSLLRKIQPIRAKLPHLRYILLVDAENHLSSDVLSLLVLKAQASSSFEADLTSPETPSVLHYTSGSTGKPKGVQHVHRSVLSLSQTGRELLGLQPDDIFWCTADQGWVTGTSYGIIAPWSLGVRQVHFGGIYDAEKWLTLLEREEVSVWYSAPTALRMLTRENPELFTRFQLPALRHIYSVGEPLNPEIINWGGRVLKHIIYDTWFQTETGAIMISNRPGLPVKPGSMGQPVSGVEACILDEQGKPSPAGKQGNLCLKPGWPSMFVTYINNATAYQKKFRHGYYYTGDMAYRDINGYFWFTGRSDDVINTAGHLVSPFEVESCLLELPEITESGVIGAPDELLFEKVVAFISLKTGVDWSKELELKIRLHVSNRVSPAATPQDFRVVTVIPKNRSGKIMRRVLRAWYAENDPGDLSTMESKE